MLAVQRMYGTFLIAFYEEIIQGGQEVIAMSKQLVTSLSLLVRSNLALVVRERDSAFRWMDHYRAYKVPSTRRRL